MEISYENKTVIVTGAAAGIGKAIVEAFLVNKACVLLVDYNEKLLNATLADLEKQYPQQVAGMVADLSQAHAVGTEIVEKAATAFGSVDILINNAGIYPSKYSLG